MIFRDKRFTLFVVTLGVLQVAAFGGQSVVLKTGMQPITFSDPQIQQGQSWRVEFQVHDLTPVPAGVYWQKIMSLGGEGLDVFAYPDGSLALQNNIDGVTQQSPCFLYPGSMTNFLVRVQRNAPQAQYTCELWNYDGTGYNGQVETIANYRNYPYPGGSLGMGATANLAFLHIFRSIVPLGSRPPTTADGGDWTELKLDGNLKDTSGNKHDCSGSGVSYVATPNQVAIANPKTYGAPSWSNWTSLRAGFPAQLDGTASYSLSDAGSGVAYFWQEVDGPSQVIWADRTSGTPVVSGLIFGTYHFLLKVTDPAGNQASSVLEVGAVATDSNGVVVNADPNVDRLFGPMIAFGKNPWGFADERAKRATELRTAAYAAKGLNNPTWTLPLPGTVSYVFNGVGGSVGSTPTTLSTAIPDATAVSLSIADASVLDLSSLPTRILIGDYPREEIRICGASAVSGPATLTVCYDGRGTAQGDSYRTMAKQWATGSQVGQMKVRGSATTFLKDLCPAGTGPTGLATYATGTVTMTHGANALTGTGTAWNLANGVVAGSAVRVNASHGGTPFVFWASIATVNDTGHLTLSRPYPADADNGTFSYAIVQTDVRQITMHYARTADGSDSQTYFFTSGCESDTDAYLYVGHDIGSLNRTTQNGKKYGYMDGFGYVSAFGANFYGEDLAHRALYYRSGWQPALNSARTIGDNYVSSPQIAGGDIGGIPLLMGGGVIGGFASAILDSKHPGHASWADLRGLAALGAIGASGCSDFDTRDSGYSGTWLTLAANFDPDPVKRAAWKTSLAALNRRDNLCKGADNSWSNGFLYNAASVPLTVTAGSATVTGSSIPKSLCFGIASGTASVTNGSAAVTGSGFVAGNKIVLTGTMAGMPYSGHFVFQMSSAGAIILGGLWPGDTDTVTYVIENSDYLSTIGTSNSDPQLSKNWACTWNNSSQITLHRPWNGPSTTNAHMYSYVLSGFGQQPYMLGIKITQMMYGSQNDDPAISSNYQSLGALAATWVHDVGYDPVTQGMYYGRVYEGCEPASVPPATPIFIARTPGCNFGMDPSSGRAARTLTAEASQALRVYYEAAPSAARRDWGDHAYGSIWGRPDYTTGGVYSDTNYVRDENSDASLGAYKWAGFFFGMGMSHQWPAVRVGGVAAIKNRTVHLSINRPSGAVSTSALVTSPSGAQTEFNCETATACSVAVDDRQGTHWLQLRHVGADGKELSHSDPALLAMAPS